MNHRVWIIEYDRKIIIKKINDHKRSIRTDLFSLKERETHTKKEREHSRGHSMLHLSNKYKLTPMSLVKLIIETFLFCYMT